MATDHLKMRSMKVHRKSLESVLFIFDQAKDFATCAVQQGYMVAGYMVKSALQVPNGIGIIRSALYIQ